MGNTTLKISQIVKILEQVYIGTSLDFTLITRRDPSPWLVNLSFRFGHLIKV